MAHRVNSNTDVKCLHIDIVSEVANRFSVSNIDRNSDPEMLLISELDLITIVPFYIPTRALHGF